MDVSLCFLAGLYGKHKLSVPKKKNDICQTLRAPPNPTTPPTLTWHVNGPNKSLILGVPKKNIDDTHLVAKKTHERRLYNPSLPCLVIDLYNKFLKDTPQPPKIPKKTLPLPPLGLPRRNTLRIRRDSNAKELEFVRSAASWSSFTTV